MRWVERGWAGIGPQAILLSPLSLLYGVGWSAYAAAYAYGLKRPYRSGIPVVCVGSLAVGGAGKSPTAMWIASQLAAGGHQPVLGLSGYGSPRSEAATLAPGGPLEAAEWGDEPSMVRWLAPDLPLVVGRDRVLAARLVEQGSPGSVLVMDDGFQHLRLAPTASIVLDEPKPRNSLCLPAGPYREPRSAGRERATCCIPGEFSLASAPLRFVDPGSQPLATPEAGTAVCAIARPERFFDALESAGVRLAGRIALPDHDPLVEGTLLDRTDQDLPLIVTAKDWVKLRARRDLSGRAVAIALQETAVKPADAFMTWLLDRIDALDATRTD
jgi:tetraacyldisaccharide 4'-kinase